MKNWTPKTVAIWQDWHCGHYRAFKKNYDGPWFLSCFGVIVASSDDLQEVMDFAVLN